MNIKNHIIIGTSAAAIGCANTLRRLLPNDRIVCISAEKEPPYNKCFLADYAHGEKERQQTFTLTRESAEAKNIELMLGIRVESINRGAKSIALSDGNSLSYDSLFIGTGASPFIPPIKNIQSNGVFTFHTLRDVDRILNYVSEHNVQKAIVIGAGLSGLEAADALVSHNVSVTLFERAAHVLSQQIGQNSATFIERKMNECGVEFIPNVHVNEIMVTNGRASGVRLEGGETFDADIVICATGVRPNIQLAQDANLSIEMGGIKVDRTMRTSDSSIFAGGDCIVIPSALNGALMNSCLWPDAMQQGMIAAHAIAGKERIYQGAMPMMSSAFFGIKFAALSRMPDSLDSSYHIIYKSSDTFHRMFLIKDNCLKGFCLVGNTAKLSVYRRAVLTGQSVDQLI